jgi:uncharacterized protein YdgA (DUF945 family)
MKKTLLIALGAVLLIVLALPALTGIMTQSRLEQRVALLSNNPFTAAEVTAYDRGWFASTARIELGLSPQYVAQLSAATPAGGLLAQRVPVVVELKHGPIIFDDGMRIALSTVVATFDPASPLATFARDELGMPYVFELRGQADLGGGFVFDADIPPIDYGDGSDELDFSGLRVDGTLRGNHVTMRGNADSLDYVSALASAVVERLRFALDQEYGAANVALGSGELSLARIVVTSPLVGDEPLFTAQELRVGGDSAVDDNGLMRVGVHYGAASVAAGTGFNLTDADLGIAVADLDAAAMKDYYATMQLVMGQQPAASPDEVLAALVPVFERLLEGGPSIAVDPIRFAMNGEPFSAKILIEVDPAALPSGARNYQDPSLWLAVATISAEAEVSKALAQDVAQQVIRMQLAGSGDASLTEDDINTMAEAQAGFLLVSLLGQGMLRDDGDSYVTNAHFASGTLTINGTQVPLGL